MTQRGARSVVHPTWGTMVVLAAAFTTWEILARTGVLSPILFPAPTRVAARLWEMTAEGEATAHVGASLRRLLPAIVLGGLPALVLGLLMGWSPKARAAMDPIIAAAHPVPKITILPLVMVIFGLGDLSMVVVISISVFFPLIINTMAGVRQISPLYLEVAENYGANRWRLFTRVILPGSLPTVLYGFRIAVNVGLLITIAAEIAATERGLGAWIWMAWEVLRPETLYAGLFVSAGLGFMLSAFIHWLHGKLTPWQTEARWGVR